MYLLNSFLIFCLSLCCPLNGFSKMYKWVDENGKVHFTDQEPPEEAKEVKEYGKDEVKKEEKKQEAIGPPDLEILDIKTKFIKRFHDSVEYSIRVTAKCTDPNFRGKAMVTLRPLDASGFALDSDRFVEGKVVPGESTILSSVRHLKYSLYKRIHKWEVADVSLDPE